MMTRTNKLLTVLGLCATLTACSGGVSEIRDELGLKKESPDEFRVVKRAPLEMPTEYTLPVPRPGDARPQEPTPRDRAKEIIAGTPVQDGVDKSDGEKALLGQAGAVNVDPNIRSVVDSETKELVGKKTSVMEKLGIREPKDAQGNAIDPTEEAKKLEESGVVEKVVRPVPANEAEDNFVVDEKIPEKSTTATPEEIMTDTAPVKPKDIGEEETDTEESEVDAKDKE